MFTALLAVSAIYILFYNLLLLDTQIKYKDKKQLESIRVRSITYALFEKEYNFF